MRQRQAPAGMLYSVFLTGSEMLMLLNVYERKGNAGE